ncbi:MAG: glycosyltransferase family 39 protein, partial [Candidatus Sungbacteria bacterium]|nr:glycosyltransferase family 39 protein [Candidatus Sungbacteria bacterium]
MSEWTKSKAYWALLVLAGILAVAEIAIMIMYRETWADEIFSAFKGYLILKGELVPFQNGIFDYAPLTVMYGLIHYLFGPDLYTARILSSVFLACALALVFWIGRRLGGRWAGTASLLLVLSNLLLVGNYVSATMYSFAILCLLSVVALEISGLSRRKKTILIAAVLALAILGRTNMIAATALYALYLLVIGTSLVELGVFAVVTGTIVVLGYLPIVLPNPSTALSFILGPYISFGPFASLPRPLIAQSFGRFLEVLVGFIREYFGFVVLFLTVVGTIKLREFRRLRAFARENSGFTLLAIFSAGLFAAHFLYWRIGGNLYYANYFMPLAALAGAVGITRFFSGNTLARVLLVSVVALNFAANSYRTDVISNPREESDLARVERGADFIRAHTGTGDKILTFDNSLYHVFLADRRTFMPLMQRDFLFLHDADDERVRSLGFYNLAIVRDWMIHDADYFARQREQWPSSLIRRPFWGVGNEDTAARTTEIEKIIREQYEPVGAVYNVYPRKYTDGNDGGTLELYRRK